MGQIPRDVPIKEQSIDPEETFGSEHCECCGLFVFDCHCRKIGDKWVCHIIDDDEGDE